MTTVTAAPPPVHWRRLALCLAASALLHTGLIVSPALRQLLASARPEPVAALEVRIRTSAAEPLPMADALLKDTREDESPASRTPPAAAPLPIAAGRTPPRTAARDTSRDGAHQRAAERKLAEHLFYPPEAVAAGIEGEVRLLVTLDASGKVAEVDIASGSGHAILDRAAVAAAKSIGRLPASPKRELLLPVVFRLE